MSSLLSSHGHGEVPQMWVGTKPTMKRQQTSLSSSEKEAFLSNTIMQATTRKGSPSFASFVPLLSLVTAFVLLLLLLIISGAHKSLTLDFQLGHLVSSPQGIESICGLPSAQHSDLTDGSPSSFRNRPKDKLLGGLLSTEIDKASCYSRYQSALYWKVSGHKPSAYLQKRLGDYEALHRKCGPNTQHYKLAIEQLKSNYSNGPMDCNYLVWTPADGLGNRLMTIVSAFLYALLTNKVLLLYLPEEMHNLFCEPFPNSSWVLPSDFPVKDYKQFFFMKDRYSYGNLLRDKVLDYRMDLKNGSLPALIFLYLRHDYNEFDKMFFCDEAQLLLNRFPWLIMTSNQYFAPAFFLMPRYADELDRLFPVKDAIFHHLGRYLFHPSNTVWGYIARYYETYLANARKLVGIQIRIFQYSPIPFADMLDQVMNCTLGNKILPDIVYGEVMPALPSKTRSKLKSVLVTSLDSGYYEKLKNMYYEHSTISGEIIGVYQPSHEETQRSEKLNHNMKALAEMYLLSFSDTLVTTRFSTFGYVAQSLGGLKPWVLANPKTNSPACSLDMSIEPCFQFIQSCDCKTGKKIDKGAVVPHVKHCPDFPIGIKLYNL